MVTLELTIPEEVQQVALETLFEFTENTKLEYAYQMLLLVMLKWADVNGQFSLAYPIFAQISGNMFRWLENTKL